MTVWIGTSWKMTKTLSEAVAFVDEVSDIVVPPSVRAFILPAHTALATVRARLDDASPILLGAQNADAGPEGPPTGEVSMRMVRDAGATIVEIGHSERRRRFGESDADVAAKTEAALAAGLVPLICVGESRDERSAGRAESVVVGQVRAALSRTAPDQRGRVLLAYEPVWAIGDGGTPARSEQVALVMAAITEAVEPLDGTGIRGLLYGGSADADNALDLLAVPHLDGLFVGRAAWTSSGFIELVRLAAQSASLTVRSQPHPRPAPVA